MDKPYKTFKWFVSRTMIAKKPIKSRLAYIDPGIPVYLMCLYFDDNKLIALIPNRRNVPQSHFTGVTWDLDTDPPHWIYINYLKGNFTNYDNAVKMGIKYVVRRKKNKGARVYEYSPSLTIKDVTTQELDEMIESGYLKSGRDIFTDELLCIDTDYEKRKQQSREAFLANKQKLSKQ